MMRRALFAVATGLAIGGGSPLLAEPVTTDDLREALRQRDEVIAALEKRIAALEAQTPPKVTGTQIAALTRSQGTESDGGDPADDELALEALSRGLIERGVLLLPKGALEVSTGVTYSHTLKQGLVLVDTPEGISTVSDQRQRNDAVELAATGRLGLPWHSQIQIRVPYSWKRQASALGDGSLVSDHETHLGDVELELSHQFLIENGAMPALIGAVSWRFPTGSDPFRSSVANIASGGGTHQVSARVTALKTIDPLVLFTSLSYSANLSRHESFGRVHPGDAIDWQLGGLLAVSPETSLSFGLAQQFRFRTSVDGASIPGSDGVAAVAQFGIDQVLSSRTLLDVSLGMGLTRDAPDYQLRISIPVRLR